MLKSNKTKFGNGFQSALWLLPVAGLLIGKFLPTPNAWGINHLYFLDDTWFIPWVVLAGISAVLLMSGRIRGISTEGDKLILQRKWSLALGIILMVAFWALRCRTQFLGDGLLISDLVGKGHPFRAFDNLDYLSHVLLYRWIGENGGMTPVLLYQVLSVAAGGLSFFLVLLLLERLSWDRAHKVLFLGLFFTCGASLFFFGYVESYSFLYLFLTLFLIAGLLVMERRFPLWGASALFGISLLWHLTAVFSLPALVFLALKAPQTNRTQKWVQLMGPVLGLFVLGVGLHVGLGFNLDWFHREFLANKSNTRILMPLTGQYSVLSWYNLVQQVNLVILLFPVAMLVFARRARQLVASLQEPRIGFLVTQVLSLVLLSLFLDRKLGHARDWDLLAGHAAGFLLLASIPLSSKGGKVGFQLVRADGITKAILASVLVFLPWVGVNASKDASVRRFSSLAQTFPPHAKAYAFEGLGQYHREAGDLTEALDNYLICAASLPGNARFHKLAGSAYLALAGAADLGESERIRMKELAVTSYEEALRLDPAISSVRDNLSRLLVQLGRYQEAKSQLEIVLQDDPSSDVGWSSLGYCQLQAGDYQGATTSFGRALALNPDLKIRRYLGLAFSEVGDYKSACSILVAGINHGESSSATMTLYLDCVWSLLVSETDTRLQGQIKAEADEVIKRLKQSQPLSDQIDLRIKRIEGWSPDP